MYIEMFKTGEHTDANGITNVFSSPKLSEIAERYESRVSLSPENLAPVVLGHPESSEPARGWVKHIFRRGDTLVGDVEIIDNDFLASLKEGKYRNVSIAIDKDLNFIHLGFLGAVTPAVEGLNPAKYLAFSSYMQVSDEEISSHFESASLQEKINQLENEKLEFSKKISEYEEKFQALDLENYINNLSNRNSFFSNSNSRNLALKVLKIAQDLDGFKQSKSENLDVVRDFLNQFSDSEERNNFSHLVSQNFMEHSSFANTISDRNLLHQKALELINQNPHIKYEDALNICSK